VIHALWESGDQAPLIMPASVPLADTSVSSELTRNLEDAWKPVLDADIDGPDSLPVALDRELAGTLGRYQAARRGPGRCSSARPPGSTPPTAASTPPGSVSPAC
ncbi:MAG: hypothetical protein ACRDY0_13115, partial [Acidimicrobiales bacterium]